MAKHFWMGCFKVSREGQFTRWEEVSGQMSPKLDKIGVTKLSARFGDAHHGHEVLSHSFGADVSEVVQSLVAREYHILVLVVVAWVTWGPLEASSSKLSISRAGLTVDTSQI